MAQLKEFEQLFSNLRTDRSKARWPETTLFCAPHKPFLLLSVMDHITQGVITENFIEPTLDLVDTFNTYWSSIMPMEMRTGSMAYPFSRLSNDGVWDLVAAPGESINIDSITSMRKLIDTCIGARFPEELFQFMMLPKAREGLRTVLINTYFMQSIRSEVLNCGVINQKAYDYSKSVLVKEKQPEFGKSVDKPIRDQGFRRAIVNLYEHRCAICGIRIRTIEGHTVVEAAHIKPWSISFDDSSTNGMALCKLCHWTYDKGLVAVDQNFEVKVSKQIKTDKNLLGHVLTLSGRSIFTPENKVHWPSSSNLEWHLSNRFKIADCN